MQQKPTYLQKQHVGSKSKISKCHLIKYKLLSGHEPIDFKQYAEPVQTQVYDTKGVKNMLHMKY